ncbi:hypothetical protein llap_6165 [Limosa lapponica baueri]|uniref:Uncharacterized protein n=1 Tax=Limosa lapponica baueri TaxID=1758121 RepID=A0A2I0UBT7_LIMLA|nr:hypothetical protein llap_6165 [Limosa lapponica baueri]
MQARDGIPQAKVGLEYFLESSSLTLQSHVQVGMTFLFQLDKTPQSSDQQFKFQRFQVTTKKKKIEQTSLKP